MYCDIPVIIRSLVLRVTEINIAVVGVVLIGSKLSVRCGCCDNSWLLAFLPVCASLAPPGNVSDIVLRVRKYTYVCTMSPGALAEFRQRQPVTTKALALKFLDLGTRALATSKLGRNFIG